MQPSEKQKGFSLVELSIVLVILGLLTGGILTGQSLIRAAELRSVTTEFSTYQTAVMTFRDKYFALPGDMRNATDFWTSAGGTGSDDTCKDTLSTGTETCNGNGDGEIGRGGGASSSEDNEIYRAWQHLANAGLIAGNYTGKSTGGVTTIQSKPGHNIPQSKLSGGGFRLIFRSNPTGGSNQFPVVGHLLRFADFNAAGVFGAEIVTPEEAWNIDTKLDDGSPALGIIRSTGNNTALPNCVSTDVVSTAKYLLSDSSKSCSLDMKLF